MGHGPAQIIVCTNYPRGLMYRLNRVFVFLFLIIYYYIMVERLALVVVTRLRINNIDKVVFVEKIVVKCIISIEFR